MLLTYILLHNTICIYGLSQSIMSTNHIFSDGSGLKQEMKKDEAFQGTIIKARVCYAKFKKN